MSDLSASAQEKILELVKAYKGTFPDKVALLNECWADLEKSSFAETSLDDLRGATHKIAGSSGSYNLPEIANAAKSVEQMSSIMRWNESDEESRKKDLKKCLDGLIKLLQEAS